MNVGTIVKLKVNCLGNKAGTLGVVFNVYGDGVQVIFENGRYDGFSAVNKMGTGHEEIEINFFLEEVGFEVSLDDYRFQNVHTLSEDYRQGKFDKAWSEFWKKGAIQIELAEQTTLTQTGRTCLICGCTDSNACEGGCEWLRFEEVLHGTPDICSKCITREVPECISLLCEVILLTHTPDEIDKNHHGDKHPCSTCELVKTAQTMAESLRQ